MPNYKGHIVGGSIAFAILVYCMRSYNPTVFTAAEWFCCAIIGALFPDIDTKSKGQKLFYRIIFCCVVVLLLQMRFRAVAFVSLVALAPLLIKHRGITHSLWFILGLCGAVIANAHFFVPQYVNLLFFDTLFFFAGAISHLWLDLGFKKMFRI
jgi:membrane-bound metal-dependent hydrolase YbcI (DUF457 family)